jgi:catechol-2,3-dioxygenase
MTTPPKFAHVVFLTSQLATMRDWYRDLLDAHVVYEGHGLCFLTHDEEHHRVALIESPDPLRRKAADAARVHHVAYTFDSLGSLLLRYEALRDKGIRPKMPIQHGVTTSIYYEDPDANLVEMQIDNFPTVDQATAYMTGPEFDEDPRGPWFAPEAMLADYRSGAAVADLTTRTWAREHPFRAG